MKECPILFNSAMVRAILEGRKSQTRRVCRAKKEHDDGEDYRDADGWPLYDASDDGCGDVRIACPYGQPGDRLWVRETYSAPYRYAEHKPRDMGGPWWYWADGNPGAGDWTRPIPSIHMPRAASRITLEITSIRVERLQDISKKDAIAECAPPSHPSIDRVSREFGYPDFSRSWYAQLWDSINGAGSWDANPWVWVIEFRRIKP